MDYLTHETIVEGLYETLLQRPAEKSAIDDKAGRLRTGRATPKDIIVEIIHSPEFKSKIASFVRSLGPDYPFSNNQSEYNEFESVLKHIVSSAIVEKVVVDVGARGTARSNSFDLLKFFAWRGVLIEANPRLIPQIRSEFHGLDADVIESAVSDYEGTSTFTLGVNNDVSSLNANAAAGWGKTKGEVKVNVQRLPTILKARAVPLRFGLLSIDIEGEDIKVLNDLIDNSDYRPRYIIIEASNNFAVGSLAELPVSNVVKEHYRIIDQTSANLILYAEHC